MLLIKINQSFKMIAFFLLVYSYFSNQSSFSSNFKDCNYKAFYIKNIKTDVTSESIIKAKKIAEKQALNIALNSLLNRLALNNNEKNIFEIDVRNLINFIKINEEANSPKRFIASFDICFNREAILMFFKKSNLSHAEVYSLPISVLPIFGSPNGYVVFDKNNLWYKLWFKNLENYDGLLRFKLSKASFKIKRNVNIKDILSSEKEEIKKIIKFNKSRRIMVVVSEPVLLKEGQFALKTYSRLYNENGDFDTTLYTNLKRFKEYKDLLKIEQKILNKEIVNILNIFSNNWKKNNLFKENIVTQVNLYVPIKIKKDWSSFIKLLKNLSYVNDFKIISLSNKVGKVRIYFQGKVNTFLTILNEKGLKIEKIKDEFVLLKKG